MGKSLAVLRPVADGETETHSRWSVKTPYNAEFIQALKDMEGTATRWDPTDKVWTFPGRDLEDVMSLCADYFDEVRVGKVDE